MSVDLTSISSRASIASSEHRKPRLRDTLAAFRSKAALVTGESTHPEFVDSFGDPLSDLDGRHRWVLDGLARKRWDPDLRHRIGEVLRENEAETHRGRNIQRTATVSHCWMMGYDTTCAHPTVVISCNQSTVLKRTMKVISQHGVLKDAKFLLKGIPFCDLRYRMNPGENIVSGEALGLDEKLEYEIDGHSTSSNESKTPDEEPSAQDQTMAESMWEDEEQEVTEESAGHGERIGRDPPEELTFLEKGLPIKDLSPIRFGAEEITVPGSGRPVTLGGFVMVDDVCFGLTAAHAFSDEDEGEGFGQLSISENETDFHLYDSDWANEDSSDGHAEDSTPNLTSKARKDQRLRKMSMSNGKEYQSTTGEIRRISAKSRHFHANGLDWALCELGERGKYAINGVYLPPELRANEARDHLIFKSLKSTPPLGKVLVATGRGVVSGIGTGSDALIKLGNDNEYRYVWSIEVEEHLSSGDSGSWVVDAVTGDVYGMLVAGSNALCQEYIIPAVDIGQDICQAMRADTIRLPTYDDITSSHTAKLVDRRSVKIAPNDAIGWDSDDSLDEPLNEGEERFLLGEVVKNSSIDLETIIKFIKDAKIRPRWTQMNLPQGRSLRTAQRAVDHLFAGHQSTGTSDRAFTRPRLRRHREHRNDWDESTVTGSQANSNENDFADDDSSFLKNPPELVDSNPNFRAEKSRRAWRAKRQADRGPKPHHRKYNPASRHRKSSEFDEPDPILQAPSPFESPSAGFQSKFEMDSEDDQGNLDPDIILVKHKSSMYRLKFPAFSIADGSSLVGHLRHQAGLEFGIADSNRVALFYKGRALKIDSRTCHEEGLKMRSEVLCVIQRLPSEELEFLSNKFHTELLPQLHEFVADPPVDADKKDLEYKKISETILQQIILKCDAVETGGDQDAKTMRKKLISEVDGFLRHLDLAANANKDSPSDWHAGFLSNEPRTGRPSAHVAGRPGSSRTLRTRRSESKDDDDDDAGDDSVMAYPE